ncbi:GNAT family N-acetyltransferase [Streptomyces capillispiralis]|uniref:Acetyltransferase (GNAT) family protein n=1 Tax=Streptomyces capillispiralis TaxID=68182 RepID=A0A561TDX9_9ACTN|nr:GNAT family N-acetyltransferase [Streptomyces capillispiralis]TWF85295.1 acetyltransferase (GNAT) family protein [Streptomyces capillispiralis]GHH90295.1 N-acetyltransferase [Streptomyces capillispiralis]
MGVAIRTAGDGDRELIVRLLDEAFQDDPVSGWVFPGEQYRRTTHHRLMAAFTDIVLAEGRVDVTEDGSACALWLSVPADDGGHGAERADGEGADGEGARDDGPAQLRRAVDPENERVELIGRLTAGIHPAGRDHEYLWMIGVVPGRQGEGLGTALIGSALDRCDREGRAAYLEASSARSRLLYERLGFEAAGEPLLLPDGPHMWPMWREPRPGGTSL